MATCSKDFTVDGLNIPSVRLTFSGPTFSFCSGETTSPCVVESGVAWRYDTERWIDLEFCLDLRDEISGEVTGVGLAQWGGSQCVEITGAMSVKSWTWENPAAAECLGVNDLPEGVEFTAGEWDLIPRVKLSLFEGSWVWHVDLLGRPWGDNEERILVSGQITVDDPEDGGPLLEPLVLELVEGSAVDGLEEVVFTVDTTGCANEDCSDFLAPTLQVIDEETLVLTPACPRPMPLPAGMIPSPPAIPPIPGATGRAGMPAVPAGGGPGGGGGGAPVSPPKGNTPQPPPVAPPSAGDCCPFEIMILEEDDVWFTGQQASGVWNGVRYTCERAGEDGNIELEVEAGWTPEKIEIEATALVGPDALRVNHKAEEGYEKTIQPGGTLTLWGGKDLMDTRDPQAELTVLVCNGRVNGVTCTSLPQVYTVPATGNFYFILHVQSNADIYDDDRGRYVVASAVITSTDPGTYGDENNEIDYEIFPPLPHRVPLGNQPYPVPNLEGACWFPKHMYIPFGAIIEGQPIVYAGCNNYELYPGNCLDSSSGEGSDEGPPTGSSDTESSDTESSDMGPSDLCPDTYCIYGQFIFGAGKEYVEVTRIANDGGDDPLYHPIPWVAYNWEGWSIYGRRITLSYFLEEGNSTHYVNITKDWEDGDSDPGMMVYHTPHTDPCPPGGTYPGADDKEGIYGDYELTVGPCPATESSDSGPGQGEPGSSDPDSEGPSLPPCPSESGLYVFVCNDGVQEWMETTSC